MYFAISIHLLICTDNRICGVASAEVFRMSDFFKEHKPKESLGIFVINNNKLYMYPITGRPVLESLRYFLKL